MQLWAKLIYVNKIPSWYRTALTYFPKSKTALFTTTLQQTLEFSDLCTCQQPSNLMYLDKHTPNRISPLHKLLLYTLALHGKWGLEQRLQVFFLARPELTNWITQQVEGSLPFCGIHLHWPVHQDGLYNTAITSLCPEWDGFLYPALHYYSHCATQIFFFHEKHCNGINCSEIGWTRCKIFIKHKTQQTRMQRIGKNFLHLSSVTSYGVSMHNGNREASLL